MGGDKIRHLLVKPAAGGGFHHFWNPSKTLRELGLTPEALGKDAGRAAARAAELNALADGVRLGASRTGSNGPPPGSFSKLVRDFKASDEFTDLKPRTQRDYIYYLSKIEEVFGDFQVRSFTPKGIKDYYKRMRRDVSLTWAYHILGNLRGVLTWARGENWITENPALAVRMKSPKKRDVVWSPEQADAYIAKARGMGWHSIVAMAHVFDSIGQSPIDVRTMLRKAYDGRCITVARAKTGVSDAPIPLFPRDKKALDAYLKAQPAKLPDAPMFTHDNVGGMWKQGTLNHTHADIREAAGLPKKLQLQDFRTTAATESGAAGGSVDQIRALQRHTTRAAGEHYVHPNADYIEDLQKKRLAHRNKKAQKVRMPKR